MDTNKLMQDLLLIFVREWEKGRARVGLNGAIRFDDTEAYTKFYHWSEQLTTLDRSNYRGLLSLIRSKYA